MKWEGRRQSDNFEDRRGMSTTGKVAAGGGIIGVLFLIFQLFLGGDEQQIASAIQNQISQQNTSTVKDRELTPQEKRDGQFISTVLADTEDVWNKIFTSQGRKYKEPKLILFDNAVQSACGGASGNSGPFYCPADETIYMDLSFFRVLTERFGAKNGEFAVAYVIAHEVGHHIQKQDGILDQVHRIKATARPKEGQRVYIAMELQADFYAGVFAHHIGKYLTDADIDAALSAAAAVGDDNIQKRTQGYVVEESFSHGTSEQRKYWLARGMRTGDIAQGNTFEEVQ